jgi:subtilisin family serine protease
MVQAAANGSVVVALIDTGCDVTNEDLNIVGGMDFTSDNSYGLDGNGHGTHVAGEGGSSSSANCQVSRNTAHRCASQVSCSRQTRTGCSQRSSL